MSIISRDRLHPEERHKCRPVPKSPDTNVEKIRELFLSRSIHGAKKYGVTTDKNPLTLKQWLQHQMEELMDAAVYCQAAITEIDRMEQFINVKYLSGTSNIKNPKGILNANRPAIRKNARKRIK